MTPDRRPNPTGPGHRKNRADPDPTDSDRWPTSADHRASSIDSGSSSAAAGGDRRDPTHPDRRLTSADHRSTGTGAGRSGMSPTDVGRIGPTLPAWSLRVVTALAGGGALVLLLAGGAQVVPVGLIGLLVVGSVLLPASPAPALVVAGTAVLIALRGGDPVRPEVLALVPLLHLVHLSSALAALVPPRARVAVLAMRSAGLRFLLVQAVILALAAVAAGLPVAPASPVLEVLGITVAAAGILALLALSVRRSRWR